MRSLVVKLTVVTVAMFGFGFLLVPLYDALCVVAGLNGKTAEARDAVSVQRLERPDRERWVNVEFVTNTNRYMPWEFTAVERKVRVHPGELIRVDFLVKNPTGRDMIGQAIPSLAPGSAAKYFHKTECFCFTRQLVKAGEQRRMPLHFIISPELPRRVNTVTLSYTFFEIENDRNDTG